MGLNIVKDIKADVSKMMLVIFTASALSPEYVAPVLLFAFAVYTLTKTKLRTQSFASFSTGYCILLFMGWLVIGAFYANSIVSSLATIGLWTLMLSGFWLCTVWVDSEKKIEKIIYGGTIAAGINGAIGIIQAGARLIFGEDATTIINPIWRFIDLIFIKIIDILPEGIVELLPRTSYRIYDDRSCGTFSNPLFFATFLVAMLSFCFYCYLNGKDKKHRRLGLVCLILNLGGIATSLSRGPYIVTVIVFVALLIYGGKKAKKVLAVGTVAGLSVILIFHEVISRLLTLGSTTDKSINARKRIWAAVFEKFPDEFLFGYGTGFDSVRSILHNEYNIKQPHAHNIILEFQMENGIIGVLLFILICVVFVYNCYKLYKKDGTARCFGITFFVSIMAMCICGMTDCIFYGFKPLQYFLMIMGLTQAAVNIYYKDEDLFPFIKRKGNKQTEQIPQAEEINV